MSDPIKDGDMPAFPVTLVTDKGFNDYYTEYPGLKTRELLAAMAMQGLCASTPHNDAPSVKHIAEWAVQQADAVLAALKPQPPGDT